MSTRTTKTGKSVSRKSTSVSKEGTELREKLLVMRQLILDEANEYQKVIEKNKHGVYRDEVLAMRAESSAKTLTGIIRMIDKLLEGED